MYFFLIKKKIHIKVCLSIDIFKPQLNPKSMMFDFEKAAMNASKYIFLLINIKGCFFHFTQSIWRHV